MATKQQVPKIAATLTEFQEEFFSLFTEDGQWVIQNGKEAAALFVNAVANRKPTIQALTSVLSNVISTFFVSATTKKFVAKDKFVVNTGEKAEVKISFLNGNFINWFLEKKEEPFSGSIIHGRKLKKNSVDGPILTELGGQEKAETTLTEIYAKMLAQPNDESDYLLDNGCAHMFYVRDINNTLRAVLVIWDGDNGSVYAYPVDNPIDCRAGSCVFSRVRQIKKKEINI